MCTIYETVLSHGGRAAFEFVEAKGGEDVGKFGDVRRRFPQSVTCGFVSRWDVDKRRNVSIAAR